MTGNQFEIVDEEEIGKTFSNNFHIYQKNVICVTDDLGQEKYPWLERLQTAVESEPEAVASLAHIVVDATKGFVPLWAVGSTLHWRFNEASMAMFRDPEAAKNGVRALWDEAIASWGHACPVSFVERDNMVDFEIVLREQRRCSPSGCVLASAFFPDTGQHEVVIYPSMFEQPHHEQIETLVHEIGHIFGLRHFFAKVREAAWPSEVFGEHTKFSIMNYGADSFLTDADRDDLARLYEGVWSRRMTAVNGTPVKLMTPYSGSLV